MLVIYKNKIANSTTGITRRILNRNFIVTKPNTNTIQSACTPKLILDKPLPFSILVRERTSRTIPKNKWFNARSRYSRARQQKAKKN